MQLIQPSSISVLQCATVMLHPPMLVMGGDYEEGLFDPSRMGRAFALYGDLPLYFGTFVHY